MVGTVQRVGILAWAFLSAGLMAVGAFGPWLTALGILSVTGWDLQKREARGLVAIALLGSLMVFLRRNTASAGFWALFGGAAGLVLTGWEHHRITSVFGSGLDPRYQSIAKALIHVGWGLDLAIAASVSFALSGLVSLFFEPAARRTTETAPSTYRENVPTVPAGWYRDPNDEALLRYWNGYGWTTQTAKPAS